MWRGSGDGDTTWSTEALWEGLSSGPSQLDTWVAIGDMMWSRRTTKPILSMMRSCYVNLRCYVNLIICFNLIIRCCFKLLHFGVVHCTAIKSLLIFFSLKINFLWQMVNPEISQIRNNWVMFLEQWQTSELETEKKKTILDTCLLKKPSWALIPHSQVLLGLVVVTWAHSQEFLMQILPLLMCWIHLHSTLGNTCIFWE